MEDTATEMGWYVSNVHCTRAIGYLSAKLVDDGYLSKSFELPLMLDIWAEALGETMNVHEPSPIGPEPELARKFLLSGIEARLEQIEERNDRIETAVMKMSKQILQVDVKGIEAILYGPTATSKTRPDTAA
jgi:hypothetical protein